MSRLRNHIVGTHRRLNRGVGVIYPNPRMYCIPIPATAGIPSGPEIVDAWETVATVLDAGICDHETVANLIAAAKVTLWGTHPTINQMLMVSDNEVLDDEFSDIVFDLYTTYGTRPKIVILRSEANADLLDGELRGYLIEGYNALKALMPNAFIAPSIQYETAVAANELTDLLDAVEAFDGIAITTYPEDVASVSGDPANVNYAYYSALNRGKRVVVAEAGWSTNGDQAQAAAFLTNLYTHGKTIGVTDINWYFLGDATWWDGTFFDEMGLQLIAGPGTPKTVQTTFTNLIALDPNTGEVN